MHPIMIKKKIFHQKHAPQARFLNKKSCRKDLSKELIFGISPDEYSQAALLI